MAKKAIKKKAGKATAKKAAKKSVAKRAVAKRVAAKPARAKKAQSGNANLRSVAPGLTVNDIEASLAWYRDVLGFTAKERWENEGKLQGVEMVAGEVSLFLGQDDWKLGRDRIKGVGVRLYITTGPKIDRFADKIKAGGTALTQEPTDGWGMRTFAVADPDGYKITFMFKLKG